MNRQMKAQELFDKAFNVLRAPRSEEYKEGVLAVLRMRCEEDKLPRIYPVGSVQFDAFNAGCDEGHRIWREATGGIKRADNK
jgi:hypothetical protein